MIKIKELISKIMPNGKEETPEAVKQDATESKKGKTKAIVITAALSGLAVALNVLAEQLIGISISVEAITDFLISISE